MKQYKLTQKVLKIGDSAGVTLPAKQLKAMGVQPGDYVELTVAKHFPELHDAFQLLVVQKYSLNKMVTALALRLAS